MTPTPQGTRAPRAEVPVGEVTARAREAADPSAVARGFLAKAALVTASLSLGGAALGLVRDQSLARLFGAGGEMDAFLVAWTVPEFAATLLVEDGLAFVLIPAFSAALARGTRDEAGDPVRSLVAETLPRLCLGFVAVSAVIIGGAPYLVEVLAPGLPDPRLAADCTRLTATCVLSFGLAGYFSAALRAHRRFLPPATIYVAYNTGIIAMVLLLGERWGVRSAAAGVAVGGCLMAAVQLPSFWRRLRGGTPAAECGAEARTGVRPVNLALVTTVLLFALCRQSQVLIERFLASGLPSGAISGLNYAQKVAQIPMTLSLMLCTVTFPVVARALADGDPERARARTERDLALACCVVLLGAATVVSCAPQIIELLFQRGAFTARDTAATTDILRVYATGLLGQTLVGVLIRSYFSTGRPTWYPVGAMAAGIAATSSIGAGTVGPWGVAGIAAANVAGITLTAALLLTGLRHGPGRPADVRGAEVTEQWRPGSAAPRPPHDLAAAAPGPVPRHGVGRGVPVRVPRVLAELGRLVLAATGATAAGAFAANGPASPAAGLTAGCVTVTAVFLLLGRALGAQGCTAALHSAHSLTRRLTHGHCA
ncbi:lipid II flippase MurJ [Streptomyces sp. NPDC047725]|uniref:lipid II flippase MurJ n=1 Tax=Streptomyces sp. NPDC047725 TaxID=3365487 RepID=UPI003720618B